MNADTNLLTTSDFADILRFNRDTASPSSELDVSSILRLLARSIGATVCSCTLRRNGWGKINVVFHGIDDKHRSVFQKKYFPRNPLTEWPESAEARQSAPVVQNPTFVANTSYRNSEFYCQFIRPLGMHQTMVILLRTGSLSRVIGMWRSDEDKPFATRDQVKAELIVPALVLRGHKVVQLLRHQIAFFNQRQAIRTSEHSRDGHRVALLRRNAAALLRIPEARNHRDERCKQRDCCDDRRTDGDKTVD